MSLETHSTKRNRVYPRRFDHEEAQRLHAGGLTYRAIADRMGVTPAAVARVCDPEARKKMHERSLAYSRRTKRMPCLGGCGRLVWHTTPKRSGYCIRCLREKEAEPYVRPDSLWCFKCETWKPDKEFPTYKGSRVRRGRNPWCGPCNTAARRDFRKSHPETEKAAYTRRYQRRREQKMATTWIVLRPTEDGYKEHARVGAASAAHAIEQSATEPGDYIAVTEGKFKVMTVAPVQAFKVVSS